MKPDRRQTQFFTKSQNLNLKLGKESSGVVNLLAQSTIAAAEKTFFTKPNQPL